MRLLIVVTARYGSVRLPKKNLRLLGGRPLIDWTIKFASKLNCISDILVSTDSALIAETAKKSGALVPWLRPSKLSESTSKSEAVVSHALRWYEKSIKEVDGVLLLQPTSPFRNEVLANYQIQKFCENPSTSIIGVEETSQKPIWGISRESGYLTVLNPSETISDTQTFKPCGNFYLAPKNEFIKNNSFFGRKTIPYIVRSEDELIDIDTLEDFKRAEIFANQISYPY